MLTLLWRERTIGRQSLELSQGEQCQPSNCYQFAWLNEMTSSDGAGEVVAVGDKVTRFHVGQRVVATHFQSLIAGTISPSEAKTGLGGPIDGVFSEYGVFNEQFLVLIPNGVSYREAATLPCAAVTAWNALYGSRPLRPGDTVLVQGTGGVSMFALQFALAGGAQVIATTSDAAKEAMLRELGAHHVINYKANPEWGQAAKDASLDGRGADYIIEIGGPSTLTQSSVAAAIDGIVAIVGTRAGRDGGSNEKAHTNLATLRRIMVGTRLQLEELLRAVVANGIQPVIDKKAFKFPELKEAYQYLDDGRHIGKVVVDVL